MSSTWFGVNRIWGWYPTSWEGFVVLIGMVFSIAATTYIVDSNSHSVSDTFLGIFPYASLIISFTMLIASIKGSLPKFGAKNRREKNFSPDSPRAYLLLPLLTVPLIAYYLLLGAFIGAAIFLIVFCLLFLVYNNIKKSA